MKKNKIIIFLAPIPPPYMGPTIATEIILNSMFVEKFNVIHIDTSDNRPLSNLGKLDLINVYLALKHYFRLLHKLIFSEASLVYIPISQTSIGFLRDVPFVIFSKFFKKKVVLHLRGGYFRKFYDASNSFIKCIVRMTLRRIDRMIVLGSSLKILFKDLISEEKLSVVPNGLNIGFNGLNKTKNHNFLVLFLSNLIETKGYREVLCSVKKASQCDSKIKYVFAGLWMNDNDKLECTRFLKKEKMDSYVEFIEDAVGKKKIDLLQNADILVFPTYYPPEGHPWVIIEAMAAGLPIITTDAGCITDSVINGENGFIIPKKSSDAVAEKIIYFLKNQSEKERMGMRSRELYEKNFTEDHFVQKMIDVINITLNQ